LSEHVLQQKHGSGIQRTRKNATRLTW